MASVTGAFVDMKAEIQISCFEHENYRYLVCLSSPNPNTDKCMKQTTPQSDGPSRWGTPQSPQRHLQLNGFCSHSTPAIRHGRINDHPYCHLANGYKPVSSIPCYTSFAYQSLAPWVLFTVPFLRRCLQSKTNRLKTNVHWKSGSLARGIVVFTSGYGSRSDCAMWTCRYMRKTRE